MTPPLFGGVQIRKKNKIEMFSVEFEPQHLSEIDLEEHPGYPTFPRELIYRFLSGRPPSDFLRRRVHEYWLLQITIKNGLSYPKTKKLI